MQNDKKCSEWSVGTLKVRNERNGMKAIFVLLLGMSIGVMVGLGLDHDKLCKCLDKCCQTECCAEKCKCEAKCCVEKCGKKDNNCCAEKKVCKCCCGCENGEPCLCGDKCKCVDCQGKNLKKN